MKKGAFFHENCKNELLWRKKANENAQKQNISNTDGKRFCFPVASAGFFNIGPEKLGEKSRHAVFVLRHYAEFKCRQNQETSGELQAAYRWRAAFSVRLIKIG
ncbi:MAG: hypothetical protein KJ955_08205 [Nanoarchaeota archaeon]|nr:hypothetical protein [Nanoarchaeota archaeon]